MERASGTAASCQFHTVTDTCLCVCEGDPSLVQGQECECEETERGNGEEDGASVS